MMRSLKLQGRPWSFSDRIMLSRAFGREQAAHLDQDT